jgi:hypothetical protein
VAYGARDAREIACAWAGIAWTMLLLIIMLGACLGPSYDTHSCLVISEYSPQRTRGNSMQVAQEQTEGRCGTEVLPQKGSIHPQGSCD